MSPEETTDKPSRLATFGKIAAVIFALFVAARVTGILGTCGLPGCGTNDYSPDNSLAILGKTEGKLVTYRELKRIQLGLRRSSAIALGADGKLYAAGDKIVEVYDSITGNKQSSFTLNGTPYCMSIGPDGKIYVGMLDHIEVYDSAGKLISVWASLGKNAYLTSISANGSEIWAGDAGNRVILKYNPDGQVMALVGKKDSATGAPGIIVPSPHLDVASAGGGGVWVANPGRHELELYAADGKLKRAWGKNSFTIDGFSGCCNPTDFALLPGGKFATSEKGIPRVKVYASDGKFEGVVAGFETFKPEVVGLDLAADAQGHIYVLDPASKSIRVYIAKGKTKS
ncbi:MAG: hypothetical protein NT018_09725 [Armatimonadetes bacterium]|nr:hypothetical protein [Armatimonadota bacterium]